MRKLLIIGAASVMLTGFADIRLAAAQTSDSPPPAQSETTTGPADNQIANDVDAKIAQLKADLSLTVDQEKNWPGLQTALHDYGMGQLKTELQAGDHSRRRTRDAQSSGERPDYIAALRTMSDHLAARSESLKKLADAAAPIYRSLDDRQKEELVQFLGASFDKRRR